MFNKSQILAILALSVALGLLVPAPTAKALHEVSAGGAAGALECPFAAANSDAPQKKTGCPVLDEGADVGGHTVACPHSGATAAACPFSNFGSPAPPRSLDLRDRV
jgi:hypothetical protein